MLPLVLCKDEQNVLYVKKQRLFYGLQYKFLIKIMIILQSLKLYAYHFYRHTLLFKVRHLYVAYATVYYLHFFGH
jgi:hypothetical protein